MNRQPRGNGAVVFVANDVGGPGGMEHQSAQLVRRLLDSGRRVTVIARTCELPAHELLEFQRVRTPSRPFAVAYPAFIAVASVLASRRRGELLHASGAIVVNRVDVSTVHYCHRAARGQVQASRASRPGMTYRLNAVVAGIMARAAESWCYRPQRARVLCAVSSGVASELEREFPSMVGAIRAIPNGVDPDRFRPDPAARLSVREELSIAHSQSMALFVGGDWQRKGLAHVVDALALAPGWDLVVAGSGDPAPLLARARAAGTEPRVRILGTVRETERLYAAADAFVLPTAYETFSLVTFEAAASRLPLLVSRVSGVEDLLADGLNGWFITPDGADIARRLNELRADPERADRMGATARSEALRYSWEVMAESYEAAYSELLGREPARTRR